MKIHICNDNGKPYAGPLLLKDFDLSVTKTPLFVGGSGIVIEEIDGTLMARIYPVAKNAETSFIDCDGETTSTIAITHPDWEKPVVTDRKTGATIQTEKIRHAHQFRLQEGHDYLVR